MKNSLLSVAVMLLGSSVAWSADWPQFRGTDSNSVSTQGPLPTSWDVKTGDNVAWRADLPGRGVSSPIIVRGRVIVTCSSGYHQDRLHILAFDVASGQKLWERQFWATGRTLCHPVMAVAAPTPASDGERIYAFYSSNDLVTMDTDGNLLWYRGLTHDFPAAANDIGMASSPLVVGNTVVVQVENQGDPFAAGIDAVTGETRWRHGRGPVANWASPTVMRGEGGNDTLLLQSPSGLTAHDPYSGREVWAYPTACPTVSTLVAADGIVYVPANDTLTALRVASGKTPELVWEQGKLDPDSASPVVRDGRLYVIKGGGILNCANAATGEVLWEERLGGRHWATPIVAGDYFYSVNQEGKAQVVKLDDTQGEVALEIDFGEAVLASPAAADGGLYFRSDAHLWKIAEK